jgi:hypothetical protein
MLLTITKTLKINRLPKTFWEQINDVAYFWTCSIFISCAAEVMR